MAGRTIRCPCQRRCSAEFDALLPSVREAFSPRRPLEDAREYCKDRIRALRANCFEIDEMVAIARAYPGQFGKLRTQTWPVFASMIGEKAPGAKMLENARKAEEAAAAEEALKICRPVARELKGNRLEMVRNSIRSVRATSSRVSGPTASSCCFAARPSLAR